MKYGISKYASAERSTKEEIKEIFNALGEFFHLGKILNSLPDTVFILNENRQIVYTSERIVKDLNLNGIDDILGKRPGELLLCVNSKKEEAGCGTSLSCRMCGIVNSILKSLETEQPIESSAEINSEGSKSYEFRVITHPFNHNGNKLIIQTLTDISSLRRKEAYEKIFFHDVLNATGSLEGILNLLLTRIETPKEKELLGLAIDLCAQISGDIRSHRELTFAEEGMLKVKPSRIDSLSFLMQLTKQISNHSVARNKKIIVNAQTESILFVSDQSLLKRVLNNMIKNALEASRENETIEIGANKSNDKIKLWVKNPKYIQKEEQMQIFHRSFSTKGKGRGLGTYSMKLIGEKYLNGNVNFHSNPKEGTSFYIELPTKLQ